MSFAGQSSPLKVISCMSFSSSLSYVFFSGVGFSHISFPFLARNKLLADKLCCKFVIFTDLFETRKVAATLEKSYTVILAPLQYS